VATILPTEPRESEEKLYIKSERYPIYYDPVQGIFYYEDNRPIFPNEGFLSFTYLDNWGQKKKVKISALRLAWETANGKKLPKDMTLLAKDFDNNNVRLANILCVPRQVAKIIKEALRNLNKYLKICQHPKDAYSVMVVWRKNGLLRKEIFGDSESARRRYKSLQLRFAKLITKYCVSEEIT